jgi:hypothetical protein
VASRGGQPTLFGQEALDVALCALHGLDAGQGLGVSVGDVASSCIEESLWSQGGRRSVFDQTVGPRVPPGAQQLGDLSGPRAVRPTAWLSIVGRVGCGHDPLQATAPAPHAAGRGCSTPQPSPDRPACRCAALTLSQCLVLRRQRHPASLANLCGGSTRRRPHRLQGRRPTQPRRGCHVALHDRASSAARDVGPLKRWLAPKECTDDEHG